MLMPCSCALWEQRGLTLCILSYLVVVFESEFWVGPVAENLLQQVNNFC